MPAVSQQRSGRSAAIRPGPPAQPGQPPSREPYGPGLSWRLPADATCARAAREFTRAAWTALRLPAWRADDAMLAVSELAANAWRHALDGKSQPEQARAGHTSPELWIYPRSAGTAEVLCGVFDPSGETWPPARPGPPGPRPAGPPDASGWDAIDADDAGSGRGLNIVAALGDAAGCRRTRSRLAAESVAGKVAWFAMKVPGNGAVSAAAGITPARAASTLGDC